MRDYRHLTQEVRYQISALLQTKTKLCKIAEIIKFSKSTVSREIKRNSVSGNYDPDLAHSKAFKRKKEKTKPRIEVSLWAKVRKYLQDEWSPEQISGRLKAREGICISHESIYQYILRDKKAGGTLYQKLRCKKVRKKRYGGKERRGQIPNRVSIDERPRIVDEKSRFGDWEVDTIIGKNHKQAIVTITERKSSTLLMKKVKKRTGKAVARAIIRLLKPISFLVHTITADNGKEFSMHQKIAKELSADFYFAHPYSSWERGLNENTNGLIRQYFPKGMDFSEIDEKEIDRVTQKLNNRPRKKIGFKTPNELLFNSPRVALET